MRRRYGGILALVLLALPAGVLAQRPGGGRDYGAELKALEASYQKAETAFFAPLEKAKTDAERERVQLDFKKHPARTFLPKFQELAKRAKGSEAGGQALLWIIQNAQMAEQPAAWGAALQSLLDDYMDAPVMTRAAGLLQYGGEVDVDRALQALRTVAEKSTRRETRPAALFSLASLLMQSSPSAPQRTEVRQIFDRLKRDYGDTRYGKMADGYLFELAHLQVGMTAPDFEAADQDGKPFHLSDYRGQVVVLDFWGFW
jgi:hypothetical protein